MDLLFCLVAVLIVGALFDIRRRRIPNWLTFPAVAVGLAHHVYGSGAPGLLFSLAGASLGLAVFAPFYLMGGTGAGDVKLMAAVGALLGPAGLFRSALCTALVGGVYAGLLLVSSRRGREKCMECKERVRTFILTRDLADLKADTTKKSPVLCYGAAIAVGTFLSLLKGAYPR